MTGVVAGKREPAVSRDLAVLSTSFFFIFMGAGAVQQYLIRYLHEVTGRTEAQCSWVLATIYLSFLVWRIFAPYTIHRLGDRWAIFLGQCSYTLFVILAIAAPRYWVLLAGAVLWGWGASAMWIASSTQVLDSSARTRYGSASGLFYAATYLGQMLGVLLLGWLHGRYGWPAMLWAAVAISVAGNAFALGVPRRFVAREQPRLGQVFGVLRSRQSKLLAGILFASSFGWGLLIGGFGTLLGKVHLAACLPWVAGGFYGARLVSGWYSGRISDRLGRRGVLVWGFGLAAAGMLAGLKADSAWALFAAASALGVQAGTVPVAAMAMIGDAIPPERRHLAFGAIYVWRDGGVALSILGSQAILRLVGGYTACFALFAGAFALCALLSGALLEKRGAEA